MSHIRGDQQSWQSWDCNSQLWFLYSKTCLCGGSTSHGLFLASVSDRDAKAGLFSRNFPRVSLNLSQTASLRGTPVFPLLSVRFALMSRVLSAFLNPPPPPIFSHTGISLNPVSLIQFDVCFLQDPELSNNEMSKIGYQKIDSSGIIDIWIRCRLFKSIM